MPNIPAYVLTKGGAATAIAIASTSIYYYYYCFISRGRKQKQKQVNNDSSSCKDISTTQEYKGNVSSRGNKASQSSPIPYMKSYLKAIYNPCHPTKNRNGYIALCMAENKLILKEFSKKLCSSSMNTAKVAFGDDMYYCYNDNKGIAHVRESVAQFITKRFLNPSYLISNDGNDNGNDNENATKLIPSFVQSDHIVLGAGACAILNFLFHIIAEEKEVVLIPAPYYAAFEYDMSIIAKCVPYPVHMADANNGPKVNELEAVYQKLTLEGKKVKMLLLTNPNNPLGTIYSPSVIKNCISWARTKKMHTIVDEIYALSVHDNNNNTFESVSRILNNNLGDDVHLVWALSKDFGSSGFRIGVLYSQNETIISSLANINMFSQVSHPMQAIVAELLSDDEYIDHFLDTSRSLLKGSYEIITRALGEMGIPFVPAKAGIFVYCDFSSLLRVDNFDGEDELARLFENYARIVMTPGSSQRDDKPGRFRICYAFVSVEVLKVAVLRLTYVASMLKEHGWENINKRIDDSTVLEL